MKKEWMEKSFDGMELFVSTSLPEDRKAVVVLVHGLAEHSGRYDYVVQKLNEAKIGLYRFDHRGHGKSQGEETHYDDFQAIIEDINYMVELAKKENPDLPIFLMGHSMGGFGVTAFATKYPQKVKGIVVSGGLTRDNIKLITGHFDKLDPHLPIPNELTDGVCSVEQVRLDYVKDPLNRKSFTAGLGQELFKGITWLKAHPQDFVDPVLLLHGEKDALVANQDSIDFFKEISSLDKQVKIYGNLFHEIFNEYAKDEVIQDAIDWLQKRI